MRTRIKFCGCTSIHDATLAVEVGVDAIGLIFADSPRRIDLDVAKEIVATLPPLITPVGVFDEASAESIERIATELPDLILQTPIALSARGRGIAVISVPRLRSSTSYSVRDDMADVPRDALILFDTKVSGLSGGTGEMFGWETVAPIARERRVGIAGGLTAENVGACIRSVRPYFVDVRSGIETGGKKDLAKMRAFIEAVRRADAELVGSGRGTHE